MTLEQDVPQQAPLGRREWIGVRWTRGRRIVWWVMVGVIVVGGIGLSWKGWVTWRAVWVAVELRGRGMSLYASVPGEFGAGGNGGSLISEWRRQMPSWLVEPPETWGLYQNKGTFPEGSGLRCLFAFPKLRNVDLSSREVTDEMVEILNQLPRVNSVSLMSGKLSDGDLEKLSRLKKLNQLHVSVSQLTGRGMKSLLELQELRILELQYDGAQGTTIAELGKLPHLWSLIFKGPGFGDEDLEALSQGFQDRVVGTLDLRGTRVTDRGLRFVEKFSRLTALNVIIGNVGDEGLKSLVAVKGLSRLSLARTKVTADGLEEFRRARPEVRIFADVGKF